MAYVVLARKWRPKRFEDVVGQEHITTTLINSIRSGRTAHAYLFVGPRGIGKTSTARIFATALNCAEASDGEPCGECDVCREIALGRSLDVIEIDGASNNGVEDIRVLRENVRIAPASLRFKVYIIDEVHMLSGAAFNAFLKTLEEPPEHIKFIMATTEAYKIPATVLSRCQRFDFRRLTSRQIHGKLESIVGAEGISADDGALFAIARAADGSMRDAQSILDQLVSFSEAGITLEDVHAMLGTVGQDVYKRLATAVSEGDSSAILKIIDDVVERGKDLAQFVKELTLYFRNLLVAGFGGGEELIDMSEEDLASLKEVGGAFRQSDLIRMVEDLSDFAGRFRQAPSTRVVTEMLLLKMAHVGGDISIDSLLSKLVALEKRIKDGDDGPSTSPGGNPRGASLVKEPEAPRFTRENDASAPDQPPDDDEEEKEDDVGPPEPVPEGDEDKPQLEMWRGFLEQVREQSMSTYSFLSAGRFCGIENGMAIVCFDPQNGYSKKHLEEKNIKKLLEKLLKSVAGEPISLKFIIESEPSGAAEPPKSEPPKTDRPPEEDADRRRADEAMADPIVRKTVELFKGKIVYVGG